MIEVWKDIKGFEGRYQISNTGKVKSFLKNPEGYVISSKNESWYMSVRISKDNVIHTKRVHRLVAEHFLPQPGPKEKYVHHIDGNKHNNNVTNLMWIDGKTHTKHHARVNPSMVMGLKIHNQIDRAKMVYQFSLEGKYLKTYPNSQIAGLVTGVCPRNIAQVASKTEYKPGKTRKQAGGYIWSYKKELQNENNNSCERIIG